MGDVVTMPVKSTPELLALHAVRLKGMADDHEVAARFNLDPAVASEYLLDFQAFGWISRVEFAGTTGWTLTKSGRVENEHQLARELDATSSRPSIHHAYEAFLPHNDNLLRACTDWQLRPVGLDPLVVNGHTDQEWDRSVLNRLSGLGDQLRTLCRQLDSQLVRFQGYDDRFWAALARVVQGERSWVTRTKVDSCHTVWMELHEDLIATLGVQRGGEPVH